MFQPYSVLHFSYSLLDRLQSAYIFSHHLKSIYAIIHLLTTSSIFFRKFRNLTGNLKLEPIRIGTGGTGQRNRTGGTGTVVQPNRWNRQEPNRSVQYCTVLCSTVQYCTVLYSTVQYCTVLCSTVQYCTVLYSTVQYCTVLYSTVQYCTDRFRFRPVSVHAGSCEKGVDTDIKQV